MCYKQILYTEYFDHIDEWVGEEEVDEENNEGNIYNFYPPYRDIEYF